MESNGQSLGRKIKGYYTYGRPQQISIPEKLWFILHVETWVMKYLAPLDTHNPPKEDGVWFSI
jgi:hypothetical protein